MKPLTKVVGAAAACAACCAIPLAVPLLGALAASGASIAAYDGEICAAVLVLLASVGGWIVWRQRRKAAACTAASALQDTQAAPKGSCACSDGSAAQS